MQARGDDCSGELQGALSPDRGLLQWVEMPKQNSVDDCLPISTLFWFCSS